MISLGLIAAIAVAVPAIGLDRSIKKAIKKEVSKQISNATGPAGATGAPGLNGTARAYATVTPHASSPCAPTCAISDDKGVTGVTRDTQGFYCVTAPGIGPNEVSASVTVQYQLTNSPEGNTSGIEAGTCGGGSGFSVLTERQPLVDVRNSANNGLVTVSGLATAADDVGFTIVIP